MTYKLISLRSANTLGEYREEEQARNAAYVAIDMGVSPDDLILYVTEEDGTPLRTISGEDLAEYAGALRKPR